MYCTTERVSQPVTCMIMSRLLTLALLLLQLLLLTSPCAPPGFSVDVMVVVAAGLSAPVLGSVSERTLA
jgi:hypothetical protein